MGNLSWYQLFITSIRCRDKLRKAACLFAGLGHLQPLLLATTNANYLLDRFCMERCCSGEYISRIVTSLIFMEVMATLIVAPIGVYIGITRCSGAEATGLVTHTKPEEQYKGYISSIIQLIITLGYFQILISFTHGGKKGYMHWFYSSLILQYFVICLIAGGIGFWDAGHALWYLMAIPVGPTVVFFYQLYIHSWIRNNGPRYPEYLVMEWQIVLVITLSCMGTFFWILGYAIPYNEATLTSSDKKNTTEGTLTTTVNVNSVSDKKITINSVRSNKSGQSGPIPITVTATLNSDNSNVTITATVNIDSGTITMYKNTVTVTNAQSLTPNKDSGTITVQSGDGQTSATLTKNSVEVKFGSLNVTPDLGSDTYYYTYRTFYPNYGHYISKVGASDTLWDTEWDGGECEYAEYYQRAPTSGSNTVALAVVHVRILGGLDTRYFGTSNTTTGDWKIINADKFYEELDKLRGTDSLTISGLGTPSKTTNLVKGIKTENYNTEYSMVLLDTNNARWQFWNWKWNTPSQTWLPLVMQGLSVGAVGSIFPNLIPKTLTSPKTTRTLSVINMFIVPLPHIINLALADNGWPSWSPGNKWEGGNLVWPCSWLFYLFYIMALLFAIFNVHYPEWRLCTFLRNNTWFVFLMTLFTNVLNEVFNAISRGGIMTQKSANKKLNHPLLWNKMACLLSLSYLPFWMTTTPMMKSYVSSLDPFLCDKDRDHWPTARYGRLRSFGYWCKCACRGLYNSPRKLVTLNMRKALTRKDPKVYFLVTHDIPPEEWNDDV